MTFERRVFNFSSGPSALPEPVLRQMQAALLNYEGLGRGVLEISHRSAAYETIQREAEANLRALLDIPPDYAVLFLHGGARLQFTQIPMNLLWETGGVGDYIVTGSWGQGAVAAVGRFGAAHVAYDGGEGGHRSIPTGDALKLSPGARYVHYTLNETIEGVEFFDIPEVGTTPLICDASSTLLSRPLDVSRHALIYAGAQKNLGIAGVTVVIARRDFLAGIDAAVPDMLSYAAQDRADSRLNTPAVIAVFSVALMTRWLRETYGTLAAVEALSRAKAARVYKAIDGSRGFYRGHAEVPARSLMNVSFFTPTPALDRLFCAEAEEAGLVTLEGYRTMGGMRASLYNAVPMAAAEALADFMGAFRRRNG